MGPRYLGVEMSGKHAIFYQYETSRIIPNVYFELTFQTVQLMTSSDLQEGLHLYGVLMGRRKHNVLLYLVIIGAFPVLILVYLALYTDGK